MGRNQCKKDENTQNQKASPPPRNHNSSPAKEQSWMENESDELIETGFRRWVVTNYSELKVSLHWVSVLRTLKTGLAKY